MLPKLQRSRRIDLAAKLDQYKLQTEFRGNVVIHTTHKSNLAGQESAEVKETWRRDKELGAGAFGAVWREVEDGGELRALKILPKAVLNSLKVDYMRELEALVELRDVSNWSIS